MATIACLVTAGFCLGAINDIALNVFLGFLQGIEKDEK